MTPLDYAFAGVYGERPVGDEHCAALRRPFEPEGAHARTEGRFALCWRGVTLRRTDPVVLVDGHLFAGFDVDSVPTDEQLSRLRGEFALVAYDPGRDEGCLAVDHVGDRGLVWRSEPGQLWFASDLRTLLAVLPDEPGIDPVSMAHWLAISSPPGTRTLYSGVSALAPGTRLRFGGRRRSVARYWTPRYEPPRPRSRAEVVEGLRAVVRGAIDRRTAADGSTGLLLSGGLDSSTVAALATSGLGHRRPTNAYSAVFPDHPSVDESELIERLARTLRLRSTQVRVRTGSVVAGALEYINYWRVPPASPNLFFWFPLLRAAAGDGMSGLLDGEGGDEVFGLAPYLLADRIRHARVLSALDLARRMPGGDRATRESMRAMLREFGVKGAVPPGVQALARRRRPRSFLPPWLRAGTVDAYLQGDVSSEWKRLDGPRWWAQLASATALGLASNLAHDHIRRRGALAGVGAHHPLHDVDVITYMLGVDPELSYDTRFSRPLLREATDGILDDAVRLRPAKSTFDAIFHECLGGPDLPVVRDLLDPRSAAVGTYVDLDVVRGRLLDQVPPPGSRLFWGVRLWRLVTAECWLRSRHAPVVLDTAPPDLEFHVRDFRQ